MADIGIFYATISGRTRRVAELIADALRPHIVACHDLRDTEDDMLSRYPVLILGSPTYGTGDWHYRWQKLSDRIKQGGGDLNGRPLALFALGDAKHHAESFAGAMNHLDRLAKHFGARQLGRWPIDESYDQELCQHLLIDGHLPGLVLDQISQRRLSPTRVAVWTAQLKEDVRGIEQRTREQATTLSKNCNAKSGAPA